MKAKGGRLLSRRREAYTVLARVPMLPPAHPAAEAPAVAKLRLQFAWLLREHPGMDALVAAVRAQLWHLDREAREQATGGCGGVGGP